MPSLNRKITKNKTDHLIVKNELKKLKTFDSSHYNGQRYFEVDGKLNYLMFGPLIKYFKLITNTKYISSRKSKVLSDETIKSYTTSDNRLTAYINRYGEKLDFNLIKVV